MKRNNITIAATAVVALLLLLTFGAPRASADTLTFALTSDHCGNGGCLGSNSSAGTVQLVDISGGVTVTVSLNSGFQFIRGGFDTGFGFNLSGGPTITFSNVTSGFTPNANPESPGSLHMDGTGFFQYGVNCTGCGAGASSPLAGPLVFTITGTGVSTASFTTNGGTTNQFFAVDLIGPNGNTGGVDASGPGIVPDGGMTLMLLGGALVGLETLRRKFRV